MLFNIILHDIRVGRRDHNLSLIKITLLISDDHLRIQRLENIAVWCLCHGHDCTVILFHVGLCNIVDRDQPLQLIFFVCNRKCEHILRHHEIPCIFQRNVAPYTRHLPDCHVFDTRPDVVEKYRRLHLKMLQHILGFRTDLACPHRHVMKSSLL